MVTMLAWAGIVVLSLALLDRTLLRLEARGWINYRRHGLSRGAALYHTFELQSIFDPGIRHVQESRFEQRRKEDDSGAPPGSDPADASDREAGGPERLRRH